MVRVLTLLLFSGSPLLAQVVTPPKMLGTIAGPGSVVELYGAGENSARTSEIGDSVNVAKTPFVAPIFSLARRAPGAAREQQALHGGASEFP